MTNIDSIFGYRVSLLILYKGLSVISFSWKVSLNFANSSKFLNPM